MIFSRYGFLGSPGMGKCAKEEISANTKLKAELTKTQKSLLGYCHHAVTAHERSRQSQSRGEEAEEQLLSQCQGEVWQHSPPCEGYTLKWEFSCPTCLSCKTTAALENCNQLIISSSGIFLHLLCQVNFFELCTNRNNASLLQGSPRAA